MSLLGFQASQRSGAQWCRSRPLHNFKSRRRRSLSVNVVIGRYCCHRCHSHGNQLELSAAATKLPLHRAAIDLCRRLLAATFLGLSMVRISPDIVRLQRSGHSDKERRQENDATGTLRTQQIEQTPSIISIRGASIIVITLRLR